MGAELCVSRLSVVEVTGAPKDFELVGEMLHTDVDIIGEFSCSDDMLNQIHRAARQSTLTICTGYLQTARSGSRTAGRAMH